MLPWAVSSLRKKPLLDAQYLELVYSQCGTLYELTLNATRATNNPSKPSTALHVDGVIGSVKTQSATQSTGT